MLESCVLGPDPVVTTGSRPAPGRTVLDVKTIKIKIEHNNRKSLMNRMGQAL